MIKTVTKQVTALECAKEIRNIAESMGDYNGVTSEKFAILKLVDRIINQLEESEE